MARETIDQLARRLAESLPQGVKSVRDDLEQNFRTILNSGLARLELVTREEFEVQEAVLARTRAKLEALEKRMSSLESDGPAGTKKKKTASRPPASPRARAPVRWCRPMPTCATGRTSEKETCRQKSRRKVAAAKRVSRDLRFSSRHSMAGLTSAK